MSEITMPEEMSAELLLSWAEDRSAREMATQNVPGLALGVHYEGESVSAALGAADLRGKTPVTSASRFRWCSITKPFTATLALALMIKGLIDLDEPVARRLPTLTLADHAALKSLSMRHLLTHTTGFECELDCDLEGFGEGPDALANAVAAFGSLTQWTAPGSCWGYCNSGYWLAAHLCALANRSTYEEAMTEHVLSPLGLRATGFEAQGAGARVLAAAYAEHESGPTAVVEVPPRTFPRCRRGSGGLVGPIDDLMRFAAVHLHPETSPWGNSVMQLQSVQAAVNKDERQLLGWYSRRTSEGWTVEHDGSWGGFESRLVLLPSKGFAIGVLCNKSGGVEVLRSVTDFALAKLDALHPERPASVELAPDRSRYEGEYAWDHGVIAVDATDKGLVVLLEDGTAQHFFPVASDEFISGAGEELSFPSPGLVRLDERLGRELHSTGVTP